MEICKKCNEEIQEDGQKCTECGCTYCEDCCDDTDDLESYLIVKDISDTIFCKECFLKKRKLDQPDDECIANLVVLREQHYNEIDVDLREDGFLLWVDYSYLDKVMENCFRSLDEYALPAFLKDGYVCINLSEELKYSYTNEELCSFFGLDFKVN